MPKLSEIVCKMTKSQLQIILLLSSAGLLTGWSAYDKALKVSADNKREINQELDSIKEDINNDKLEIAIMREKISHIAETVDKIYANTSRNGAENGG